MDAVKWVEQQMSFELLQNESTILFFDPPYEDHKLYLKVLNVLKDRKYQGEVWIEADNLKGQNRQELLTYLELTKIVEQGDHFVLIGKLV
jgi:16S rRNA G966 N2-methylase RsmD